MANLEDSLEYYPRHNTVNASVPTDTHIGARSSLFANTGPEGGRFGARNENLLNGFPGSPMGPGTPTLSTARVEANREKILNNNVTPSERAENEDPNETPDREDSKNYWRYANASDAMLAYIDAPYKKSVRGGGSNFIPGVGELASPFMPNIFPEDPLDGNTIISVPPRANPRPAASFTLVDDEGNETVVSDDVNGNQVSDNFEDFVNSRIGLTSPAEKANFAAVRALATQNLTKGSCASTDKIENRNEA